MSVPHEVVPQETGFLNRTLTAGDVRHRYQVYLPAQFSRQRQWPVILFLHGSDERGDDGLLQTDVGLGSAIRRNARRLQAVVVFPQARDGTTWRGASLESALLALDQSIAKFDGDPRRLYLTGISMGGYGVFQLALERPHMFAALVPICGGLQYPPRRRASDQIPAAGAVGEPDQAPLDAGRRLAHLPIWIFHGAADPIVPVTESRLVVDALRRAGSNVRYTEYPRVGHDAWTRAYGEPEMMRWLLKQESAGLRSGFVDAGGAVPELVVGGR